MNPTLQITPTPPTTTATDEAPKGCELGRRLSHCALRRAGCGSLYEVLKYLYPPHSVIMELRNRADLPPEVADWLRRLEALYR